MLKGILGGSFCPKNRLLFAHLPVIIPPRVKEALNKLFQVRKRDRWPPVEANE